MSENRGSRIIEQRTAAAGAKDLAVVKKKELQSMVTRMAPQIAKALPNVITPERFTRLALSAISGNKELAACTQESFLGAMMTAAQLGLEPNTPLGQAYLIPYGGKVQFQLGYHGEMDLFYRSGGKSITAEAVYENDEFRFELGLEPKLEHKPCMGDRGAVIAYYATFHTKDGGYGFKVMSINDLNKHRDKYSKAKDGPWDKNFDAMAKKTCIKQALKFAPKSTDMQRALSYDEAVRNVNTEDIDDDTIEYIDITDSQEA